MIEAYLKSSSLIRMFRSGAEVAIVVSLVRSKSVRTCSPPVWKVHSSRCNWTTGWIWRKLCWVARERRLQLGRSMFAHTCTRIYNCRKAHEHDLRHEAINGTEEEREKIRTTEVQMR
jgi:hypothetical protein